MSDYSKLTDKVNGRKIQVDSAIRDGQGNKIDTRYITSDGYYEQLGAGYADVADNLTPYSDNSGLTKDECFTFQTSGGGSDIGSTSQLRELKGKTFALNQALQHFVTGTFYNVVVSRNEQDITLQGTVDNGGNVADFTLKSANTGVYAQLNHKYLYKVTGELPTGGYIIHNLNNWTATTEMSDIVACNTAINYDILIRVRVPDGTVLDNVYSNVQVFDLTLMFGAGNEPTSVEEFNRLFPKTYYDYNKGQLMSGSSSKVITTGFNAFDEEIEIGAIGNNGALVTTDLAIRSKNYTRVVEGQKYTYYIHNSGSNIVSNYILCEYDIDKNFIKRNVAYSNKTQFELTANTSYVKLCFYTNDVTASLTGVKININLSWDGNRDGEYEPYVTHEYSLPNIELRSAGSVYDSITPNGTHTTRIAIIDLGSLTWDYGSESGHEQFYSTTTLSLAKLVANSQVANIKCAIYVADSSNNTYSHTSNKTISLNNEGRLFIYDSDAGTDATTFKNSLSGVYLCYELNEPTTEQVSSYTENIAIDDFGTQESVGNNVPQCSTWFYAVDYKAFIDSLGNRQDIDFDASEIVSHTELTNAISQIPQPDLTALESNVSPKTNNTYDLGSSTYKWKNIFLSGGLKDGTNSVSVSQISNGIFNVIKVSEMTDSIHFSNEQLAILTNGKPTLVQGAIANYNSILIYGLYLDGIWHGRFYGFSFGVATETGVSINQLQGNAIAIGKDRTGIVFNKFNGKTIPDYPSKTGTFVLKCVDGVLTWVAE